MSTTARILVTGASGQLGGYLLRELRRRHRHAIAWSHSQRATRFEYSLVPVDITDPDQTASAFAEARPDRIIHSAALSRVDLCHRDPDCAEGTNALAAGRLAELAARRGASMVAVSTDLVFDGEKGMDGTHGAYREADAARPLSIYGKTKLAGESAVLAFQRTAVVRVSLMFGPSVVGRPAFFDKQVEALHTGDSMRLFVDEWRTPLSLQVAAHSLITVAESGYTGLLHLGGPKRLSRLEMGQQLAKAIGEDPRLFIPSHQSDVPSPEPRPRDVSLDSSLFRNLFPDEPMPEFQDALRQMLAAPEGTGQG